jgi:hypothetical protein
MAHLHHETPQERKRRYDLWIIFVGVLVLAALAALALVVILQDEDSKGGSGGGESPVPTAATTPG